jgi:superfamily II DNA helicase RecQ
MFGRGGRDGLPTTAVLLFRNSEIKADTVQQSIYNQI